LAGPDFGIARNMKTIEWLKAELLGGNADLFKALVSNEEDVVQESLANIIIAAFVLGRHLGVSYSRLGTKIESKIKANVAQEHEIEKWYGDFSDLLDYLGARKR